jgi:hypothetical protein
MTRNSRKVPILPCRPTLHNFSRDKSPTSIGVEFRPTPSKAQIRRKHLNTLMTKDLSLI